MSNYFRFGVIGSSYIYVARIGIWYRVDEVCDAANSADHNQSNAAYCYRRQGMVRVYVCT